MPRMVLPRTIASDSYAVVTASWVTPGRRAPSAAYGERAVWDWIGPIRRIASATSSGPRASMSGNCRARLSPRSSSQS